MTATISHAIVLPDGNFSSWLDVVRPYMNAFERVVVIRSPAGNDLNRYRVITAVNAPQVWFRDDPVTHIQRAYPMVVRVDVIPASTPSALASALQRRINNQDRFGEKETSPRHLFDRFVVEWPTSARPSRIVRPFVAPPNLPQAHEGVDISAYRDAGVLAGAPGTVTRVVTINDALNYGAYVQVTSQLEGQTYIVTYAGLKDIAVQVNRSVKSGDKLGAAAGDTIKIVIQNPPGGMSGYKLANVLDPTTRIYWQGIRLRPNVDVLRVRSHPGTYGAIIGAARSTDMLETQEGHGRTLEKLGVDGQWIKIRRAGAREAYCAAWYLEAFGLDDPAEAYPGIRLPGMNVDLDNVRGRPNPGLLPNLGWVRMVYNVSLNPNAPPGSPYRYGNTDLNFTFHRYRPFIEAYASAGNKIILVLTHQTYGEGQGYVWPNMTSSRWREFTAHYSGIVRNIASQFANQNLIFAYQIWNEQDTRPADARSAVPIPAADYAHLLGETIKAIRSVDTRTRIITGGHVQGPEAGSAYARTTINALPGGLLPDGIAFHPYGRGPAGHPFSTLGTVNDALLQYGRVLPGRPLWITEWGVLDRQGDDSLASQVSQYASGFFNVLRYQFTGQVAAACWYAWSDSMDNGYGLVSSTGMARQPFYEDYLNGMA